MSSLKLDSMLFMEFESLLMMSDWNISFSSKLFKSMLKLSLTLLLIVDFLLKLFTKVWSGG